MMSAAREYGRKPVTFSPSRKNRYRFISTLSKGPEPRINHMSVLRPGRMVMSQKSPPVFQSERCSMRNFRHCSSKIGWYRGFPRKMPARVDIRLNLHTDVGYLLAYHRSVLPVVLHVSGERPSSIYAELYCLQLAETPQANGNVDSDKDRHGGKDGLPPRSTLRAPHKIQKSIHRYFPDRSSMEPGNYP